VSHEKKHASEIAFASQAQPEVMQASRRAPQKAPQTKVDLAEQALASGNPTEAGKLAQQSLQANEDPARAYFVLAKVASFGGDMQGAQTDFQKAIDAQKNPATDPHVAAWSHIYLGRILDLQGERDDAVAQYKAALGISDVPADAKTAAERGVQQPYEPPAAKHQNQDQ
jgi:tetratricopeptide (TPR) repeat protein